MAEARVSLAGSILRAWGGFRAAQAAQQKAVSERRILFYAFLTSLLLFIVGLPSARLQVPYVHAENPLTVVLAARFFGAMFVLPLLFYGLAAIVHLVCRIFRGNGNFQIARLSLFWALLVSMPLLMAVSLAGAFLPDASGWPALGLGLLALAGIAVIWGEGLAEAEGFARGWLVSLALVSVPLIALLAFRGISR